MRIFAEESTSILAKRIKYCEVCEKDFSTVYRIQYKQPAKWVFTCESCLLKVKKDNPLYKYGGTWKR
ncbi:MAG: hypothetical protein CMB99_09100 [Flavobacteriaceae bacterium]|nr:hypothetical protein [Flavobacteriaceae bacterium]|tara:strand:- start:519121 stop:519321 length:201 start_codon:yes stop_codon:yes gene_type:complete